MKTPMSASNTTPPITPPAIAPALTSVDNVCGLLVAAVGVGVLDVVERLVVVRVVEARVDVGPTKVFTRHEEPVPVVL